MSGAVGGGNSIVQLCITSCRVVDDLDYEDKKHVVFEVEAVDEVKGLRHKEEKRFSDIEVRESTCHRRSTALTFHWHDHCLSLPSPFTAFP